MKKLLTGRINCRFFYALKLRKKEFYIFSEFSENSLDKGIREV